MLTQPYQPRAIRFLELWQEGDWRLKVYGIAYERPAPRPELLKAAREAARARLSGVTSSLRHYSVGFLGVHDGRTANFIFVDWWADENELHHHVYASPSAEPAQLSYVTPTGVAACVWDLRVMAFERQAWLETILQTPGKPDFEQYLQRRLNEDS